VKEKYIEERYRSAMVFGAYPDGRVDVTLTDGTTVIAESVTPEQAATILAAFNTQHGVLVEIAQAFSEADDEAFRAFWYGQGGPPQ